VKRRLVIAAHADDETIGCGGTIAKFAARGAEHFVGVLSRDVGDEDHAIRRREAEEAWKILGVTQWDWAEFRHHPLPDDAGIVDRVASWITQFEPDLILIPHAYEQDLDHARAGALVQNAMIVSGRICRVLAFEVWTPLTSFRLVEDITDYIDQKTRSIAAYSSQVRHRRYDLAARGLAAYRGHITGRGEFAEVFDVVAQ
jgi:LmbE family N-acetylglucosaminyl deacetylase